ncbi:MAG: hypothetical protein JW807_07425 [Spirochaetes bacterium]|nr:hypothetical protein [Spirochaetota bacterium]
MRNAIIILGAIVLLAGIMIGCKKTVSVECVTKLRDVKVWDKSEGATFTVICPAKCTGGTLWGTDIYMVDSSVCLAAAHAGVITREQGGNVKVKIVAGLDKYPGSVKNGIKSKDWNLRWGDTAYTVSK